MKFIVNLFTVMMFAVCSTAAAAEKASDNVLVDLSKDILKTLSSRNYKALSGYVHPVLGLRLTPYSYIDLKRDRRFTVKELSNIRQPKKKLVWGEYDGSGEPIKMTIKEYFGRFVYDADFLTKGEVTVNEVVLMGNTVNNVEEAYPGCDFVDFMIPMIDPQYEGIDWRALRLVFKKEKDKFYLIGIIHNEHTI
jgi:hypothetical protein